MSKKILVIDDEEILTRSFTRLLEKKGYDVYVASRGEDAEAMVEEEDFDLIISDIRMPGKNGVETVQSIRDYQKNHDKKVLPVVFMTGFADEKLEHDARELNPLAFLHKPFDVQQLLTLINEQVA